MNKEETLHEAAADRLHIESRLTQLEREARWLRDTIARDRQALLVKQDQIIELRQRLYGQMAFPLDTMET